MSMAGYPAPGLQAVTGFLVEQWVGLRIQATLSCYCPQVLPRGTLLPGAGRAPDGWLPAGGHQNVYAVSSAQVPYTLGGCALPLQRQERYQHPILPTLRTTELTFSQSFGVLSGRKC